MTLVKTAAQRKYFNRVKRARSRYHGSYGTATHGYQRMAMRRMTGPPAALYPRVPTNALALKSVDVSSETFLFASSQSPAVLVVPKLGSAFFNRLSNRTRGVSLHLIGQIAPTFSNAAIITQTFGRIIVYYDRQPNGANPATADILLDTHNDGSTTTNAFSQINMNNRDRFMILRDRKVVLPEIAIDGVGGNQVGGVITDPNCGDKGFRYTEFIKLNHLESLYNSTNGGTIGDISSGAFGILVVSNDSSGSPGWLLDISVRFKFLD